MKLLKRPLALSCLFFIGCSVAGYFYAELTPNFIVASALACLVLLALFLILKKRYARVLLTCLFCALFSCAAFTVSHMYFVKHQSTVECFYGQEVTVRASVSKVSHTAVYGGIYSIETESINGRDIKTKLRLQTDQSTLTLGEGFSMNVIITPFEDDINGYAERITCMSQGYLASCEQTSESYVSLGHESANLSSAFSRAREWVSGRFFSTLGSRAAALYSAVFAGDNSHMTDYDMMSVRRAGVSHLLAVSGMHFSIVMGALLLLLSSLGIPIKARYLLLGVFAFIYAAFTGFSASVMRSALMLAISYIGSVTGKNKDPFTSLCFAMTLILLFCPYLVLSASLWLSCSATLGIILFIPVSNELFGFKHKKALTDILRDEEKSMPRRVMLFLRELFIECIRAMPAVLLGSIVTGIAALVFSLPFSLLFFGSISLVSVPCTLMLSVIVTAVLVSAPAVLIFGGLSPVSFVCTKLGELFFLITHAFSDIDGVYINIDYTAVKVTAVLFFLFAALTVLHSKKQKPLLAGACCFLVAVFVCVGVSERTEFSGFDAVYGASGGECITLRAESGLVIIDMGSSSRSDINAAVSASTSLKQNEISAYVFTTVSTKHTRLITYLLSNNSVDTVYLPKYASKSSALLAEAAAAAAKSYGCKVGYFSYGKEFSVDGCSVTVGELEYLSRSSVPLLCVCAQHKGRQLLWLSRAFYEGEKYKSALCREYDAVIFGTHGPLIKKSCDISLSGLSAEMFAVGDAEVMDSFSERVLGYIKAAGLAELDGGVYRFSLESQ